MLTDRLTRYFQDRSGGRIASAYLFGSEATGFAHRESDVDVAVLLDPAHYPDRETRSRFKIELNAELIHVLRRNVIDLVILNDAPPELGRAIVQKGIRVYRGDARADHNFVRDVQLRAADVAIFLERMRRIKLRRLRA